MLEGSVVLYAIIGVKNFVITTADAPASPKNLDTGTP